MKRIAILLFSLITLTSCATADCTRAKLVLDRAHGVVVRLEKADVLDQNALEKAYLGEFAAQIAYEVACGAETPK